MRRMRCLATGLLLAVAAVVASPRTSSEATCSCQREKDAIAQLGRRLGSVLQQTRTTETSLGMSRDSSPVAAEHSVGETDLHRLLQPQHAQNFETHVE